MTISAIDVHGHYGRYDRVNSGQASEFMTADGEEVARRARHAHIELTCVSPLTALLPRGRGDSVAGNLEAARVCQQVPGLRQYVVLDPRQPETFAQAESLLGEPHCVGIKIHPEEHEYSIREQGAPLFEFAARHRAVVLSHSSEQRSLASDLVDWANRFPEVTLILAHIGCGWDGDYGHQVRGVLASKHGNVYADTSSARSITPRLIEWAVAEVGPDRVLFGTDTPLYHAAMQRARIDTAELPDSAKQLILRDNAIRIFKGKLG